MIDISRPLCRGRLITLDDGKEHWVSFKYERLTNLYYWCGCTTHVDRDYKLWIESEGSLNLADQQFGPWLHAPPFQASRKKGYYGARFLCEEIPKSTQTTPLHPPLPYVAICPPNLHFLPPHPTHPGTGTNPLEAPKNPPISPIQNLPNQPDFDDLIHEIDSEINRFDSEAIALQNSNIPQPAPNPNSPFPPPLHLSPLPDGPDSQPKKPNPLRDLTNLGPTLSQSQAQSGGKWIRVLRPAHFSESYPLDSSTGKRKSHSPQTSSLPSKRRALDAAIADENSFLTAKADFQPHRAL